MFRSQDKISISTGYKTEFGPSYKNDYPDENLLCDFIKAIPDKNVKNFIKLWHFKAIEASGIPVRKAFDFNELVRFGTNIIITKHEEKGRWLTTFCGSEVVNRFGIEFTGKYLDEMLDDSSRLFWLKNFDKSIKSHAPYIEKYRLNMVGKDHIDCLDVNLPLKSNKDSEIDIFLSILSFAL